MTSFNRVVDTIEALVETTWTLAFAVAGRFARPSIEWSSAGGQRVWAIAPHPDDEAIGCAATLVRHLQQGDAVSVVFVTDGGRSRALGLARSEMIARREREARASMAALGVGSTEWLGFPEGNWTAEDLRDRLRLFADHSPPDVLYVPSRVDFHPEHHRVAHSVAAALPQLRRPPIVRVYQIHVPLTSTLVNVWTDVAAAQHHAGSARAAYVTQADSVSRTRRMRRYAGAFHRGRGEAEEFWQLTAREYSEAHADDPRQWGDAGFRGIRGRAFADPLAYWIGRRARRRLTSTRASGQYGALTHADDT